MINFQLSQYDIEQFLLILVRISSFLFTAPIFSMSGTTPRKLRVGFAVAISILIFPLVVKENVIYDSMWAYMGIVIKEAAVGILIGFMANVCINIISFAGMIIDMQIGFSMVTLFDPTTREQTSITGTMYMYFIMLLLVVTNMYQYIIRAVVDSYQLIPVNGVNIHAERLLKLMLQYTTDCFVVGFRIVLPFFTVTLLLDVILGILAKIAPQMNMFVIGMQLKIFVGLTVMIITAALLPSVANFIFTEMKTMMVAAIEAMS